MKKHILICCVILLLLSSSFVGVSKPVEKEEQTTVQSMDGDIDWWPKFQHDAQNTGNSTSSAPTTNNILWTYETDFMIGSSPAIVEGKVYIGSDDEKFYCLDADTGDKLWDYSIPGGTSISSPAVANGKVYVGTTYYYIYCWNATTGNLVWKFPKEYGHSLSPVVINDKVYITKARGSEGENGILFCLDAETGEELWNYDMGWYDLSSPVYYDGKVYIGSENWTLYCFDADGGNVLWTAQNKGGLGSPTIFDGKIYSGYIGIHCLHASNGTKIWSYSNINTYSSPAVANDKVYFLSRQPYGGVYCLDSDTGDLLWYYYTSNFENCFSSPAVADGKIYVGLWSNGKLICLDANLGEFIWEYQVGVSKWLFSSPAVANGTVYIGSSLYKVYAFGGYDAPPEIPGKPSGPTEGEVGEEYNYSTNTTDPEDDMVQYRFDWDADSSHDISNWTNLVPSGTNVSMGHTWHISGTYVVKVQARDEHYALSNWSDGLTVLITGNAPPNPPSNPDPPDGETDLDVNVNLSWTCNDPDDDNLTYNVYFEANDPSPDELVSENQSETIFDPGTMNYSTHYYWQIVAWDECGDYTEGPVWDFTTMSKPNHPPYSPSDPDPPDGSIDVDIDTDLSWNCGDPDEEDTVVYDVFLDGKKVADDISETTFDPGTLDYETTYYWSVVAKDNHGAITWGPIWNFTTELKLNYPPGAPVIQGPSSGDPGTEYEYIFNAVDPDGDNVKYHIDWGDETSDETGLNPSGTDVIAPHSWSKSGNYVITAYAEDSKGLTGPSSTFQVTMPRDKATSNVLLLRILERFLLLREVISWLNAR